VNELWEVCGLLAVVGVGSVLAMWARLRFAGRGSAAPWRVQRLLEEYRALEDLGRVPRVWPAVLLLAGTGLVLCALLLLLAG